MSEKVTVKILCGDCSGTGLYHGFNEKEGVAVICWNCNGTGAVTLSFKRFTERLKRDDVEVVFPFRGSEHEGKSVTYEEFEKGKFPS